MQDNAVVSGYATIEPNATIRDDARVTDYAIIREGATVENSARVMEHADINRGIQISNYAVCKGNAEVSGPVHGTAIIDGNYIKNGNREKGYWFQWSWGDGHHIGELDEEFNQLYLEYKFEKQDDYRVWDTYGATWARLLNGPTYVKDHEGTVLELDGKDDFVDLHQSVAQFESVSFDLDVWWDGGAKNQNLINFSNSATGDAAWLSPCDDDGKLAFSIQVGDKLQVVRATKPLPAGSWVNVKLMTFHDTLLIHVDDVEWAKSENITLDIEDVNANECYIGRGAKGNNFGGRIDNLSVWSKSLFDTLPPDPNPADFLLDPMVMDGNSVMMQARLAADSSKPVEYFFEETSGNPGGSDSGWQESPLYFDLELSPGKEYEYTVRARDTRETPLKPPRRSPSPRRRSIPAGSFRMPKEPSRWKRRTTIASPREPWMIKVGLRSIARQVSAAPAQCTSRTEASRSTCSIHPMLALAWTSTSCSTNPEPTSCTSEDTASTPTATPATAGSTCSHRPSLLPSAPSPPAAENTNGWVARSSRCLTPGFTKSTFGCGKTAR